MGKKEEDVVFGLMKVFQVDWPTPEDLDDAMSYLAEDAWFINHVPLTAVIHGREAIKADIERQMKYHCTSQRHTMKFVASSDTVVFTERVDEGEINGQWVTAPLVDVFEVADGKVTAWREYWDIFAIAQQVGVTPEQLLARDEHYSLGRETAS